MRTGKLDRITPMNAVVSNINDLANLPVRTGSGPTVFMRDIGWVEDGSDITLGYALVNGRRTVYLPVTKRADASTLAVVNEVKSSMSRFANVLPPDVQVSYEFDQSGRVKRSLAGLDLGRHDRGIAHRLDGVSFPAGVAKLVHRDRVDSVRAGVPPSSACGWPIRPSTS